MEIIGSIIIILIVIVVYQLKKILMWLINIYEIVLEVKQSVSSESDDHDY